MARLHALMISAHLQALLFSVTFASTWNYVDDCPEAIAVTSLLQVNLRVQSHGQDDQNHTFTGGVNQTKGLVLQAVASDVNHTERLIVRAVPSDEESSTSLTKITAFASSFLLGLIVLDVGGHLMDRSIKDAKRRLVLDHLIDGAAACLGLIASFTWYSLIQEYILQHKYPSGDEFPDASFLILFDRIFAVVVSGLALAIAGSSFQIEASQWAIGPGFLDWLSSYLIDKSVLYLAYPVVTVFKCSKVVPTMFCNALLNGEKNSMRDYALAVLVVAGVFGFNQCNPKKAHSTPKEGAILGIVLIVAGLIADALTSTTEKLIFRKCAGFSHMNMMFSTSIVGTIVGFIACVSVGFGEFFSFLSRNPEALGHMFMLGTSATLGVYFIFYLIDHHGPVTMALAMLVKQIFSVYMSAMVYHHTVTPAASACAFLTFGAVLAKPVLKYYSEDAVVQLKTGILRQGLTMTAQIRAQLGHEVQASATVLLAAARLKAVLLKASQSDSRLTTSSKEDSFVLASKAAFDMFDREGSGSIDTDKLGHVLSALGHEHTLEELEAMIGEIDGHSDGTIHFTEFTLMLRKLTSGKNEKDLREAFDIFDEDKSGSISGDELRHVMANIGETLSDEDVSKLIEQVDTEKKGEITFNEFVSLMES